MNSRLSLLAAVVVLPLSLFAQDSVTAVDATPFRRGQWAAQFLAGFSSASVGFLKFRSSTRAHVLDFRLSGFHAENSVTDTAGTRFTGLSSDALMQIRFGWRRYRAAMPKVTTHYTVGLLAGLDHDASRSPNSAGERNTWSAGVFGDIGGTYLIAPQFGLGALGAVSLSYAYSSAEQQPGNIKGRTWQIGGSAVNASLVATLFF